MADQTITTNTNFDDASISGLLNGENITINSGAVLTVNSDVRWGQNAAVPWDITINNGELKLDGTQVWWVPFSASSGNVPSLGTPGTLDVTRSGTNVAEFLGIFTALGVAPSTAGAAMPTSGWIKFRRTTATLANGDVLTFAGGATATLSSAGQRGWLHFVGREATGSGNGRALAASGLARIVVTGEWFELGTASGSSGQTLQHYVQDYSPGLQIETAAGSGVYEWWGACATSDFNATNIATDARGRFYSCTAAGVITFGGATFGRLPPSGARIRVPNIHVSSTTPTNYALNTINTASPLFRWKLIGSPGSIDINGLSCCGGVTGQNTTLFQVRNSTGLDGCFTGNDTAVSSSHSNITFENVCSSGFTVNIRHFLFGFSSNISMTDISIFRVIAYGSGGIVNFASIQTASFTRFETFVRSTGSAGFTITGSTNVTFNNCSFVGAASISLDAPRNTNVILKDCRFTGAMVGTTNGAQNFVTADGCTNFLVDGLQFFANLSIGPLLHMVNADSCRQIRFRNIGTRNTPLVTTGRTLATVSNTRQIRASRVFYQGGAGQDLSVINQLSSNENTVISDCGWSYSAGVASVNIVENLRSRRTIGGGQKNYSSSFILAGRTCVIFSSRGVHFVEQEVAATELMLTVMTGSIKTTSDFSVNAYTDDAGTPVRDANNGLLLRSVGDQVTWTWGWNILGVSSLQNTAPLLDGTNTGNFTLTYDLDKGTGFSGTFKALTGANLAAETGISASIGFKLRLRAVCNTANADNLLRAVSIFANTTQTLLTNNPYPFNEPQVSLSNMTTGSMAAIFRNSDGRLLDVQPHTLPRLYPAWYADTSVTLRVRRPGWNEVENIFTLTELGGSFPLNQTDSVIADSNPGTRAITVTNHGTSPVTWNGKTWSITVTVTDGSSAAQIAQWLSWHTAQDSFSLGGGFHNMAWPVMVVGVGTAFETARGTLFGSAGASLKGVRVVDGSGNEVPGFARMQADDGTYYSPAVSYTLTVSNIVNDSRILVRRTDTLAVISNQTVTGGTFTYNYIHTSDIPIEIVVRKATSSPFYQEWRTTTTLSNSNNSQTANQILDT